MEAEKEKKDKLAAARKKLNEYKLSRSGGGGRNNSATEPVQPADVPLFYQNLNTPAATFNLFNPAAGNNNNVSSAPYFVPASEPSLGSAPQASQYTSNQTDDKAGLNANFFLPQQQFSTASIFNQDDRAFPTNPFTSAMPMAQPSQESPVIDLSTQNNPFVDEPDVQPAVSLFSAIPQQDVSSENLDISLKAVDQTEKLQSDNVLLLSPSSTMYAPSAPLVDLVMDQVSPGISTCATVASSDLDESNQELINENHSVQSSEETQSEENVITNFGDVRDINLEAPVPVFASSLFGATDSETDAVFNFSASRNPQPHSFPILETLEHSKTFNTIESKMEPSLFDPEINQADIMSGQSPTQNEMVETTSVIDSIPATDINTAQFSDVPTPVMNVLLQEQLPEEPVAVFSANNGLLMTETKENFSELASNVQNSTTPSDEPEMLIYEEYPPGQTYQSVASIASDEAMQQLRSVQEALELQIEELRRENTHLLGRQSELASRIEESEKLAHEFKLERDRVREEAATTSQALRSRINSLCEENQRVVKNSTDIGVDLRAKLEEKSKQLEEMQKAVIIVSQSKMEFAGRLDHELEQVKELQSIVQEKDNEIQVLRDENNGLREKLKQDHQRDAVIHQLQDQSRHYQVQCETMQKELFILRNKLKSQHDTSRKASSQESSDGTKSSPENNSLSPTNGCLPDGNISKENENSVPALSSCEELHSGESGHQDHPTHEHPHQHEHGGDHGIDHHHHDHVVDHGGDQHHHDHVVDHGGDQHHHDHGVDQHRHDHVVDQHHHDHGGDHHHHEHGGDHHHHDHGSDHHHHDHGSDHHHHDHGSDHHHHDHTAEHSHDLDGKVVARVGPSDEVSEMKKTLHRLHWENSSFRSELDVLAVDAKQKKTYEEKCAVLEQENDRLKKEVEQLEHVIIQLQGENDTIGDYIRLYQTQRMALKECAKEKDVQLEVLAREREMLLHRLAELTALVTDLRESKSEHGSQCADDHIHTLDAPIPTASKEKKQIEGKIRDLLTEISSSSLIENFHPCAVCSGRLMTV